MSVAVQWSSSDQLYPYLLPRLVAVTICTHTMAGSASILVNKKWSVTKRRVVINQNSCFGSLLGKKKSVKESGRCVCLFLPRPAPQCVFTVVFISSTCRLKRIRTGEKPPNGPLVLVAWDTDMVRGPLVCLRYLLTEMEWYWGEAYWCSFDSRWPRWTGTG